MVPSQFNSLIRGLPIQGWQYLSYETKPGWSVLDLSNLKAASLKNKRNLGWLVFNGLDAEPSAWNLLQKLIVAF